MVVLRILTSLLGSCPVFHNLFLRVPSFGNVFIGAYLFPQIRLSGHDPCIRNPCDSRIFFSFFPLDARPVPLNCPIRLVKNMYF